MPQGDVETFYDGGSWWNRVLGGDGRTGPFDTREEALAEGRDLALRTRVEHVVRGLHGQVCERHGYGQDSTSVAG